MESTFSPFSRIHDVCEAHVRIFVEDILRSVTSFDDILTCTMNIGYSMTLCMSNAIIRTILHSILNKNKTIVQRKRIA